MGPAPPLAAGTPLPWLQVLESSSTDLQQQAACRHALAFMQPLLCAPASTDARALANEYGRPVMQALKAVSAKLVPPGGAAVQAHADVAAAALDALDRLRPALKTKGVELDRQRYGLVRKFMALGLHQHALGQAWKLHRQLQPPQQQQRAAAAEAHASASAEATELRSAALTSLLVCLSEALAWPREDPRLGLLPMQPTQLLVSLIPELQSCVEEVPPHTTTGRAQPDAKQKLQLLYVYGPKCAVLLAQLTAPAVQGSQAGAAAQEHLALAADLLRLAVTAAGHANHQRKMTQVLMKLVAERGSVGSELLVRALVMLIRGGSGVSDAAAACLEDLVLEASHNGDVAPTLSSSLARLVEETSDLGPEAGKEDTARCSTTLLALYLAALSTSCGTLQQLSLVAVAAVEAAVRHVAASPAAPARRHQQGPSAATRPVGAAAWWRRWWAALGCWSRAVVQGEDTLRSAGTTSGLLISKGIIAAMDLAQAVACHTLEAMSVPGMLATVLPAAAVAIKLQAAAACSGPAAPVAAAAALSLPLDSPMEYLGQLAAKFSSLMELSQGLPAAAAAAAAAEDEEGGSLGPDDLQWMSVCCANTGLELLQSGLHAPASQVLALAVQVSLSRLQMLTSQGDAIGSGEVKALLDKRFKAHVTALSKSGQHEAAAHAAVKYTLMGLKLVGDNVSMLSSLVKLHVRSRLAIPGIMSSGKQPLLPAAAAKAPAPAAAPARGAGAGAGRRKPARSQEDAKRKPAAAATQADAVAAASDANDPPPLAVPFLTVSLIEAVASGSQDQEAVLSRLDLVACEELACVREECRQAAAAAARQAQSQAEAGPGTGAEADDAAAWERYASDAASTITGSLLKTLTADSHPTEYAQALLLRHTIAPSPSGGPGSTRQLLQAVSEAAAAPEQADRGTCGLSEEERQQGQRCKLLMLNILAVCSVLHAVWLADVAMREGDGAAEGTVGGVGAAANASGVAEEGDDDVTTAGTDQRRRNGLGAKQDERRGPRGKGAAAAAAAAASEDEGASGGAWGRYAVQARRAGELWTELVTARAAGAAAAGVVEGEVLPALRHTELSAQAATQLGLLAHLHGDADLQAAMESTLACVTRACPALLAGRDSTGSQLRAAWAATCSGGTSLLECAVAGQPGRSLAAALGAELPKSAGQELREVVKRLEHLGSSWHLLSPRAAAAALLTCAAVLPSLDPASTSSATTSAAITAAGSSDATRDSPLQALVRSHVHRLAGCALLRAGDAVEAFAHAQEALRLASALHERLTGRSSGPGSSVGQGKDGVGEDAGTVAGDVSVATAVAPGAALGAATQASSGGSGGLLALPVLSHYMCCLLQCAAAFEALGCADDAACLLREACALATAAGARGPAALASLRLWGMERRSTGGGSTSSGGEQEGEAAAARCLSEAKLELAGLSGAPKRTFAGQVEAPGPAYLFALATAARGTALLDEGQAPEALQCCDEGLAAVEELLEGSGTAGGNGGGDGGHGALPGMRWELVSLRSRLMVVKAQAVAAAGGGRVERQQEAQALLEEAQKGLQQETGARRDLEASTAGARGSCDQMEVDGEEQEEEEEADVMQVDDVPSSLDSGKATATVGAELATDEACEWPVQLGGVLLLRGLGLSQQQPSGEGGGYADAACVLGLQQRIGEGGGDPGLEAMFASALTLEKASEAARVAEAAGGRRAGSRKAAAAGETRGRKGAMQEKPFIAAAGRGGCRGSDEAFEPSYARGHTAGIDLLLRSIVLCWRGAPTLVARAAAGLMDAAACGCFLHAAALCLHLSVGTSLLHQRRMFGRGGPTHRQQQALDAGSVGPSGDVLAYDATAGGNGSGIVVAGDDVSDAAALSDEVQGLFHAAASGTGCGGRCCGGGSSSSALQRLDCLARTWLQKRLAWLPPGSAVCSIAEHKGSGRLLVGRVEPGRTPLLVLLPAVSAWREDVAVATGEQQAGPGTDGEEADEEGSLASSSGRETGQEGRCRLVGSGEGAGAVAPLLSRLAALMRRSAQSMDSAGAMTQAHKAEWWKARVALDQDMEHLLDDTSLHVLGPWRLLLLPRTGGPEACAAAAAAAESLVVQLQGLQGGKGSDGRRVDGQGLGEQARQRELLVELMVLLLTGMHGLGEGQVDAALEAVLPGVPWQQGSQGGGTGEAGGKGKGGEPGPTREHVRSMLKRHAASLGPQAISGGDGFSSAAVALQDREGGAPATSGGQGREASCAVDAVAADPASVGRAEVARDAAAAPMAAAAAIAGAGTRRRASRLAGLQLSAATAVAPGATAQQQASLPAATTAAARAADAAAQLSTARQAPPARGARAAAAAAAAAGPVASITGRKPPVPTQQPPSQVQAAAVAAPQAGEAPAGCSTGQQPGGLVREQQRSGTAGHAPPMLLVLGPALHAVPWESVPGLCGTEFYRSASLLLSCLVAAKHSAAAAAAAASGTARMPDRGPGAAATVAVAGSGSDRSSEVASASEADAGAAGRARRGRGAGASRSVQAAARAPPEAASSSTTAQGSRLDAAAARGTSTASSSSACPSSGTRTALACASASAAAHVDLRSTFYCLNPAGDLADTQRCFEDWFSKGLRWQGVSGSKPHARQLLAALQAHDAFVYCGHGSGEQYVPLALMRRLRRCAAGLLVGCSSGKLRLMGEFDPAGAVVSYMLAGCPAVVANLWDVTDRDIDRFCEALLSTWLGSKDGAQQEQGTQQQQQQQQQRQGPGAGAGARRGKEAGVVTSSGQEQGHWQDLVGPAGLSAAVSSSRAACKLPHLIGAAPVCYGIPTAMVWRDLR